MSTKSIYILLIETTTTVCSVAVAENDRILTLREIKEPNVHASLLTVFIEEVLRESRLEFAVLSAVAVSSGPGSYTGLRIGVSVAKGLCYALDIPLIGVQTLKAMARAFVAIGGMDPRDVLYCPMIDARRMEVFTTFYDANLAEVASTHALVVDEQTFVPYFGHWKMVVLFGAGADKFVDFFNGAPGIEVCVGFENSASYLIHDAYRRYLVSDFEDLAYFEPFYLKDFVATTPKKLF